ncbi:hypothetical protein G3RUM_00417 [Candidatus Nanosyncoccus alces]|uniref:Right handed beta helix domain-containing protein n=2 Tax=Candidatus Nanosyncoccus alces TaxID=2171997 RepID=A0ABY0FM10_9BACT|nr:hypothetical protein G3RUM_00417 [Candidatus Nanosyncoccus alces]
MSMEAEKDLPKDEKIKATYKLGGRSNWGMYVGIGVVVAVVIGVIVAVIVMNMKNDGVQDGGAGSTSVTETVVVGENTELASGSVTTTIGGKSITYSAAYIVDGIEATISSGIYESVGDDEVVFLVINGGSLKIDGDVTIDKTGSEDFAGRGDDYSFYGMNSAIVVVGEDSSVEIDGAKINTSVSGANAVVATDGATAVIKNSTIATTKDNSRGLHATYDGVINADDVNISTQGGSCAALATDRGAGTVVADNMTLSTAGAGSPLIYSTGKITVTNSTGTATGAQIAVVEGKNSINLQGCEFSANGNGNRNGVDNAGVMIYQSMSGDASMGTGSFTATDCTLMVLSSSGVYDATPFFFITNTDATIDLTGTTISFDVSEKFVSALGTSEWGKSGSNGGNVTVSLSDVNATNTEAEVDSISSVSGL